ncbi:MAG: transcription antitermination factor NusB [Deltaproteobacteria bacterium]|nr:transcription antitermination factor NusB [Deltaproteobacteria bacterium]
MGQRRKARELALQLLYQMEMQDVGPKVVIDRFAESEEYPEEAKKFSYELVEGTYRNRREIDELIEKHSSHWKIARMSAVDRNILRLGVYELSYLNDVPTSVAIDEAIEIAKRFGTENSGAFINGILDNIAKDVRKDPR